MNPCSLGKILDDPCHKTTYSRKTDLIDFKDFSKDDQNLITWRAQIQDKSGQMERICLHHQKLYIGSAFTKKFTKCCNLFQNHTQKVKGAVTISLELAQCLASNSIHVIPGWKLCAKCYTQTQGMDANKDAEITSTDSASSEASWEQSFSRQTQKRKLDSTLATIGISPVSSSHAQPKRVQLAEAKTKMTKAVKNLESSFCSTIGLPQSNFFDPVATCSQNEEQSNLEKDYMSFLFSIKEKIHQATNTREKIHLLTCSPASWSIHKSSLFFEVTDYLVEKAVALKHEHGVLAEVASYQPKTSLSENVKQAVVDFYQNDQYSRCMPGMKNFVSIKKNVHVQKRLLLCNLKELHHAFLESHPAMKIGLSKFCHLRPKWCVTSSASGTHTVCVCTYHQNVVLLTNCAKIDQNYKELMARVVCNIDDKMCMVHRCSSCPGKEALCYFLQTMIREEDDDNIVYQQWESTDRCTMRTLVATASEYIEILADAVDKLTAHSYIAKCQSRYLTTRKNSLAPNECIVLLDFAENYQFHVQDEIQGFHWNHSQCTIHPAVIYYKSQNKLCSSSFCCISDDLNHDTVFVHELISHVTTLISALSSQISSIAYFSDGCAGQYKNYKNMLNLCFHQTDFNMAATWSFFATSHGKSPCDGVGGTVKKLAARASLQRPLSGQILTSEDLFEFCNTNIEGIHFFYISKSALDAARTEMKNRFTLGSTIPGTRSYHHFAPVTENAIGYKRTSEDAEFVGVHRFSNIPLSCVNFKLFDYVACKYDSFWWVGVINDISENHLEAKVKFMLPYGPSSYFSWPSRDDICWIPAENIICVLSPPISATSTGRKCAISKKDLNYIEQHFE